MKKQYLISLLGLAAISISLGNSFSSMTSSPSNPVSEESTNTSASLSEEELNTLEEYENEFPDYSIEQIEAGETHSAAIVNDGEKDSLYTWGLNTSGQLGVGNHKDYKTPQKADLPEGDIEDISLGDHHSAAIVEGDLYTWGSNDFGQLGLSSTQKDYSTPTHVTYGIGDSEIEQVSAGDYTTGVVVDYESSQSANDYLYTSGSNNHGQLGYITSNDKFNSSFVKVSKLPVGNIEQVEMGFYNSAVVIDDEMWIWGANGHGQLGVNTQDGARHPYPSNVRTLPNGNIEEISLGLAVSSAIVDGKLYTWGRNDYGQLGLGWKGAPINSAQPVKPLNNIGNVEQISLGDYFSMAVVTEGTSDELYTWGYNDYGQLGLGEDFTDGSYDGTPHNVGLLPKGDIEQISAGDYYSTSIVNNGTSDVLYTWGRNDDGQLGLGNNSNQNAPVKMWETPYLVNVSSEVASIDTNSKEVKIEYEFETSVDVESADIIVVNEEGYHNNNFSTPKNIEGNNWQGESTFIIDSEYGEYTYSIDLNYKDEAGNVKCSAGIDEGEFTLQGVQSKPIIKQSGDVAVKSSTRATVDYKVTSGTDQMGNPLTFDEVRWVDHANDDILLASSTEMSGTLKATENLKPNKVYGDTQLIAMFNEDNGDYDTKTTVNSFTMDSAKEQTVVTSENVNVINSTKATIHYNVELGTDVWGNPVTVEEVKWMNGEAELATSDKVSDTLTTNELAPNQSYEKTTIEVTVSDKSDVAPIDVNLFTMEPGAIDSTINEIGVVEVNGSAEASVSYEVTPGLDVWANDVTVEEVSWMYRGEAIATSSTESGILEASDLDPYMHYRNTTIIARMSDKTSTNVVKVENFKTESAAIPSTISETGKVDVKSPTEASVGYNVTLGLNNYGNDVTVEEVKWMNGEDELATSTKASDTLTADELSPNQFYGRTFIVATMSDGTTTNEEIISHFKTSSAAEESTIIAEAVNIISPTEASVAYNVNLGKDANGDDVHVIDVKWMNGDDELATSNKASDTLVTDELAPNQFYARTSIVAEMSNGSIIEETINPFRTWSAAEESTITAGNVNIISPTAASVDYNIDLGKSANGEDVHVTEVKWMNGENELATSKLVSDTLTTNKLAANQEYNDTTIIANMSDGTQAEVDVNDFNEENVAPELSALHHVKVDFNDDILNVKGTIDTNGSEVTDVYFVKDEQRIHTEHIGAQLNQANDANEITYDIWTKEYIGEKNANGSPDLDGYSIAIEYGTKIFEEPLSSTTTNTHSEKAELEAIEVELGHLLGNNNKLGAWTIAGISVAVILVVAIMSGTLIYLFKKYNTNKV